MLRLGTPFSDRQVCGLAQAPVLPGNEGALRFEEVLPVVHVQDGIGAVGMLVVAGRQIDGEPSRGSENLRFQGNRLQPAGPGGHTAVGDPKDPLQSRTKRIHYALICL